MPQPGDALARTPLHALHRALGARMGAFAGHDMPIQYPAGIVAEHLWTRQSAGLFDVSHMGQAFLLGPSHEATARALEALCPVDALGLAPGRQRYSQFLAEDGGILDDFMVARSPEPDEDGLLALVVNAANKVADFALLRARLPAGVSLLETPGRALLALQGPKAADVLARLDPAAADMPFMSARALTLAGARVNATRSGYTGEDGYELSVAAGRADALARALLAAPEAKPAGLGARDSLRLEAGLPLHGHDIDATTTPVEAGLAWSIGKRRRAEGGYPGAEVVTRRLAESPARRLVGLKLDGRQPARDGAEVAAADGKTVGRVTSGGFGPSVDGAIALAYVEAAHAAPGEALAAIVRGKPLPARVVALPFVPHRYFRGGK
ncbi:MAG: glycine cleavage system aminomethyltransferase GcvT [Hyphomicrobiales bacterium]|nr:glycine cleavage system aminomethyltransferase GcvT [Hyphomicrobiales bacterium]MDE2017430.1 glycine cleavage system aminomethyltransferase GcvT [Hyphomicrobiales bacterium]